MVYRRCPALEVKDDNAQVSSTCIHVSCMFNNIYITNNEFSFSTWIPRACHCYFPGYSFRPSETITANHLALFPAHDILSSFSLLLFFFLLLSSSFSGACPFLALLPSCSCDHRFQLLDIKHWIKTQPIAYCIETGGIPIYTLPVPSCNAWVDRASSFTIGSWRYWSQYRPELVFVLETISPHRLHRSSGKTKR